MLRNLINMGVDVMRINFSHGTHEEHRLVIQNIRQLSSELNKPVAILQDIQGPKIRIGDIRDGQIQIEEGDQLSISTMTMDNPGDINVDYPDFLSLIRPNDAILIDDGKIELIVNKISKNLIFTKVNRGGIIRSNKGVNLPGVQLDLPSLTQKDIVDIKFGASNNVDMIAISFVRKASDISKVRELLASYCPSHYIPLIAKLERPEALGNLEEIILASDGVMVARGDLGVEMPPEYVPVAQKNIISTANRHSRSVITATQMLESMILSSRPTRAEAADIANAVFDGTDALMLSGETAIGKYPILSVSTMHKIILEAEQHIQDWGRVCTDPTPDSVEDDAYYITRAAYELAHDRNVAAIAVFTKSGKTALLMSKTRPKVRILTFTSLPQVYNYANIFWGVQPYLVPHVENIPDMLSVVDAAILSSTQIKPGQQVVLVCGYPVKQIKPANLTLLHTIGDV